MTIVLVLTFEERAGRPLANISSDSRKSGKDIPPITQGCPCVTVAIALVVVAGETRKHCGDAARPLLCQI